MISLDRFSAPMAGEWKHLKSNIEEYQEEEIIECACGCGIPLDMGDPDHYIESELYDEEFILNDSFCIKRYYDKEKRAAMARNSSGVFIAI